MQRRGLGRSVCAHLAADLLTGADGLVYRSRAEEERRGDPREKLDPLTFGSGKTGVLGRLFAVAEAYPDLKANQNMMALQQELSATENQIASARQVFNNQVMQYNTARESFPTNLVANALGFAPAQLFELEVEKERQVPQVSF